MEKKNYDDRRRKQVESVISSRHMTRIFFLVLDGIDYTKVIAKKFGTSPKSMTINIRKMRDAGIIKRKTKLGVIQHYEPDWLGFAEILRKHWRPSSITLDSWTEGKFELKSTRYLSNKISQIDGQLERIRSKNPGSLQDLIKNFDRGLADNLLSIFFREWRQSELEGNESLGKAIGYSEAQIEKVRIAPLGGMELYTLGDILKLFDEGLWEVLRKKPLKRLEKLSRLDKSDGGVLWQSLVALNRYYESEPPPDPEPWDGMVLSAFNKKANEVMRKKQKK